MVDVHDKATRSKNMRAIATRDTAIAVSYTHLTLPTTSRV